MRFTLLCPTRDRLKCAARLLRSIEDRSDTPEEIELLYAVDLDDAKTIVGIEQLRAMHPKCKVGIHKRARSEFINGDYYSWLCQFATGKYLWIVGDDVAINNKGWDTLAWNKLEQYLEDKPDGIVYGMIDDGTPAPAGTPKTFCCFPIISHEAYKTLGFILHPEIPTWGADSVLYDLYSNEKVNRVLNLLKEVSIQHISYHTGMVQRDAISVNIGRIHKKYSAGQIMGRIRRLSLPLDVNKLSQKMICAKEMVK